MWRRQAKSSQKGTTTVRPRRFLPRLEALETRLAPASCTWDPDLKVVTGDADGDTLIVQHRLDGGGYDLICNYFEYVATTPDIGLTFDAGPGSTLSMDNRLGGELRDYYVEPGFVKDYQKQTQLNFNDNVQNLLVYFAVGDDSSGYFNAVYIGSGGVLEHIPLTTVFGNDNNTDEITVDDSDWEYGDTYRITDSQLILPADITVNHFNVEWITLRTGAGDDTISLENTSGEFVNMPTVVTTTSSGADTLVLDASANPQSQTINFDTVGMWQKLNEYVLVYEADDQVDLKCGSGDDSVTIPHVPTPHLDVNGGDGLDSIEIVDTGNENDVDWTITTNEIASNILGSITTYSNISTLTLKTGAGDNQIGVGNAVGILTGMPGLRIESGAGNDALFVFDQNNPNNDPYHFVRFTATDSNLSTPSLGLAKLYGVETINVFTGPGSNEINVDNGKGFLPQATAFNVLGNGGSDTLNYRDNKNTSAITYVVTSTGLGSGSVNVPAVGFNVSFTNTISTVNLYTSLQPGTVVDTSGYNPAHYVLNVFKEIDGFGGQLEAHESTGVIIGNLPAPPAPPAQDRGSASSAANAVSLKPAGGRHVPRPIAADFDLFFGAAD